MKQCEVCNIVIPEDYQNLLCDECYKISTQANEYGISDPSYKDNPEEGYHWNTNLIMFEKTGTALYHDRVAIYNYIKNYSQDVVKAHPQFPKWIWKPKIVDIGCSIGIGTNIMSQEADFIWGIDKNEKAIQFAQQVFAREKNNYYWSPQIRFDQIDIVTEERELMTFDIVCAIEIIEHITDVHKALQFIKKLSKKDKHGNFLTAELGANEPHGTVTFITTPNRNSPLITKDHPHNKYHVREWTLREAIHLLGKYWKKIELLDWSGNPLEITSEVTPVLFKCTRPL